MSISLRINLEPIPKGRPRFTRSGHAFTPARTRKFEAEAKKQAKAQYKGKPLEGGISIDFEFIVTRPKRPKHDYPSKVGDVSNLIKAVEDALNGVVFKDDSQVVEVVARKRYAEQKEAAGITIEVRNYVSGYADCSD